MAYYENKVELLDGDLVLYQRNLSTAAPNVKAHRKPKWYMKLRIGPNRVINRSTGLTVYEEAYSFARKEFDRLRNAVALGHTLEDFTFEKHWDDWYQRNPNNGTWRPDRQRWHKNQAARYYKAYFRYADGTSMRLNDIIPLYSLRHTYATLRRSHGVGWEDLALNMGCIQSQQRLRESLYDLYEIGGLELYLAGTSGWMQSSMAMMKE